MKIKTFIFSAALIPLLLTSCDIKTNKTFGVIDGANGPVPVIITGSKAEAGDFEMEFKWDDVFEFNKLNTYFDIHVAGMDGECFEYNIYFESGADEDKLKEIAEAVNKWMSQYDEEDYLGYISVSLDEDSEDSEDSVFIYLDLGNVEDSNRSIYGIVEAFKDVQGIKEVIVNESMADFDM